MEEIYTSLSESLQSVFNREKKKSVGARTVILFVSICLAVAFYTYTVEYYDSDRNIWSYFRFKSKNYTFFTGSTGGFYIEIGNLIESKTRESSIINVRNVESLGGSENAIKVLTTPRSFGLIQEETLKGNDVVRDQLNYVTPLYMERIHIIYRKSKFEQFSENHPQLTLSTTDEVLNFFANSRIAAGPVGSGTRIIASYILSEVNQQIERKGIKTTNQEILNTSFSQGLNQIEGNENDIDILFTIAGAPLKKVKELLQQDEYGLISILPSFVSRLNNAFDVNLRMSDFNGIYDVDHDVATLGSYCYLISSRDVTGADILEFLTILSDNKDIIRTQFDIKLGDHFQLEEFDFLNLFKSKHENSIMEDVKNIIIFIVSFSFYSAISVLFLLWVVSSRKQAQYFKKIANINSACIPVNHTLDEGDSSLFHPIIYKNQVNIINKVIQGISNLIKLNIEINQDYKTGGITDKHQNHLLDHIEKTTYKLQKNLAQRLNELIDRGGKIKEVDLRVYFTAGYLLMDDYNFLKLKVSDVKMLTEQANLENR